MPSTSGLTMVEIESVGNSIRVLARSLDTEVMAVLSPLRFSQEPSAWENEVEAVFTRFYREPRAALRRHIQRVAQYFRRFQPTQTIVGRLDDASRRLERYYVALGLLSAITSGGAAIDRYSADEVRRRIPIVDEMISSATQAMLVSCANLERQLEIFRCLERPTGPLAALQSLHGNLPDAMMLDARSHLQRLATLWTERRATVARATALVAELTTPNPEPPHAALFAVGVSELLQLQTRLEEQVPLQLESLDFDMLEYVRTYPPVSAEGLLVPPIRLARSQWECRHIVVGLDLIDRILDEIALLVHGMIDLLEW
ncbi:hypothetical protein C8Q76DRAFT_796005 [Earliella scabrosa]|nr:hypothetical protein C8Q76DRAFT_796005 [Earliella scabrosa]